VDTLNNAQTRADLDSAMEMLFKRWSKNYRSAKGIAPCERAQDAGLTCYRGKSSLAQLRRLDYPVILKLMNNSGAERYVVLASSTVDRAAVELQHETFTLAPGELEPFWEGEYLLLWRKPKIGANSIAPGTQGIAITWLIRALNRIEGKTTEGGNLIFYDEAVAERVKAFQKRRGLIVDGAVGERTLIHLAGAASDPPSPRLVPPTP